MLLPIARTRIAVSVPRRANFRALHASIVPRNTPTKLYNILADDVSQPTQIKTVSPEGIHLLDGRIFRSSCIFLDGHVFLWDVPQTLWDGWKPEHFEVLDVLVPRPGESSTL